MVVGVVVDLVAEVVVDLVPVVVVGVEDEVQLDEVAPQEVDPLAVGVEQGEGLFLEEEVEVEEEVGVNIDVTGIPRRMVV